MSENEFNWGWRPFEQCRENVNAAFRQRHGEGYFYALVSNFNSTEMQLHAEYMQQLKNPTLIPVDDKRTK